MNIDLSQHVNPEKEVIVTFRGNDLTPARGKIMLYDKNDDRYVFSYNGFDKLYHRSGLNLFSLRFDIVKIEPVIPEKSFNTLEPKTLQAIATALTPEAIKFIESHEKYAELMQTLIEEFVDKNLGNYNGELPFMIFDRMFLSTEVNK